MARRRPLFVGGSGADNDSSVRPKTEATSRHGERKECREAQQKKHLSGDLYSGWGGGGGGGDGGGVGGASEERRWRHTQLQVCEARAHMETTANAVT